jgi:UDP-N-acetylglucosamine:LPS N-acetylglucosamine transferase
VKLLLDASRIFRVIKKERLQLQKIIKEHQIDVVISDNRFGMYEKSVHCIYITHQLNIQAGLFSEIANKVHQHFIKQFNEVWIPDFEEDNKSLSGKLSRSSSHQNVKYIGTLSRLSILDISENQYDYLCLLSGPEPLRTDLEKALIKKANQSDKRICLVRGTTKELKSFVNKNVTVFDMPPAKELSQLILNSRTIVCRSGYSTLMDLQHLQKKNYILVPTPGQDEQEYLAKYWNEKFVAEVVQQKDLNAFSFT